MSHKATSWAWQQDLPALQKIVLLALADRHNSDTGRCDPSMARVAADCGMSRDSVKRCISELQEKKKIEAVERKSGSVNLSNYYILLIETTPVGANSTGGGCCEHPGVGAISPTNLEVEPVIEPKPVEVEFHLEPISKPKHSSKKESCLFTVPEDIPREAWEAFEIMRNVTKHPMTNYARELIIKKLRGLKASGDPIADVLNQSICNNWQDVYPLRRNGNQSQPAAPKRKYELVPGNVVQR